MKNIIYIIILVIGLGGALVIGYMAFFGNQATTFKTTVDAGDQIYNILPEGKTLDFSTVRNFNKDRRIFNFPKVNPVEIGQPLNNLIE